MDLGYKREAPRSWANMKRSTGPFFLKLLVDLYLRWPRLYKPLCPPSLPRLLNLNNLYADSTSPRSLFFPKSTISTMKLNNFYLLFLSFICSLSGVLSAPSQCVPVNLDGAAVRNINGASSSFFSNQITIRVVQSYIEPSTWMPFGGILVDINNQYCLPIRVTFTLPNGQIHQVTVNARTNVPRIHVSGHVNQGDVMHIDVHDAY
jgi:hypothetical protein